MSDGPLSPEQKAVLDEAAVELRRLLRPARIASVNLWTVGIFGALSILWGMVSGGGGIVVGVALLAVAWNERRGRDRLRALDPEGPRILGWNQIVLAAVVCGYCAVAIYRARVAPDPSMQELEEMAGLPTDLVADLTTLVYGAVILVVAVVQGLLAVYHFRRRERVEAFREATPAWVLEIVAGPAAGR